jgi:cytochrome c oxidase cbb3-type subunit 2
MNSGPLLFLGIFATLASSFWGLLLVPQLQLGRQGQVVNPATSALYPQPRSGLAKQGAEIYRSLGCVECHSQQVRGSGGDIPQWHWGPRISVAQDYLGDYPVLLGAQRIGPDLANIGLRQTNSNTLLQHLYNPQLTQPGSMMPSYQFLFERKTLREGEKPSPDAVMLELNSALPRYEVIPGPDAVALASYLISLHSDAPLYEAPAPKGSSGVPAPTSSTNAPLTNAGPAPTPAPAQ